MAIAVPEKGVTNGRNWNGIPTAGVWFGYGTLRVLLTKYTNFLNQSIVAALLFLQQDRLLEIIQEDHHKMDNEG